MEGVIKQLDERVVRQISAGEVIQRPCSAVKELVENAVDAGATTVRVSVRDGGLARIEVADDGCGVREEDMELLCVRHATSKLQTEEDLAAVRTLGFRGEALASMSTVGHFTCVTMREDDAHARRATYRDGKMLDVTPCAGTKGTIISVEDLFYATPLRKKALKSANEEYQKVLDVVCRYAVHCRGIGFTCRKLVDNIRPPDVQIRAAMGLRDRVRAVYGQHVATELIELEVDTKPSVGDDESDAFERAEFRCVGMISSANYSASRTTMILFVNGRCVDSSPLRRAVESVYASVLPKASKPFLYFSIETDPTNVDVNLHPTKFEVGLLNQEEIVENIQREVERVLLASNDGRKYTIHAPSVAEKPPRPNATKKKSASDGYAPQRLVRTDANAIPLEAFVSGQPLTQVMTQPVATQLHPKGEARDASAQCTRELIAAIEKDSSSALSHLLRNHVYVGMVSRGRALVQYQTGLYLIDVAALTKEMSYQIMLHRWGHLERIDLVPPLPIRATVEASIAALIADGVWDEREDGSAQVIGKLIESLTKKFATTLQRAGVGIAVSEEEEEEEEKVALLESLPATLGPQFLPDFGRIPEFLLSLGRDVEWDSDSAFAESISRAVGDLFVYECTSLNDDGSRSLEGGGGGEPGTLAKDSVMQNIISPALKCSLVPPTAMAKDSTIIMITKLERLYRVFERC